MWIIISFKIFLSSLDSWFVRFNKDESKVSSLKSKSSANSVLGETCRKLQMLRSVVMLPIFLPFSMLLSKSVETFICSAT